MEATAGIQAIKEMISEDTPVEVVEGDGDNTVISRIQTELGVKLKKKLDRNHCVKNIVKHLYELRNSKDAKISNQVIQHLSKCIKYIFAKNQGSVDGMKENLQALVPHQFGDHDKCFPRFCGYKRTPSQTYSHRSLPYKAALKDQNLKEKLEKIFEPVIANAALYSDLGSSQACEHANRAVSLRAPKHLHYGDSESLDFRVKASAVCVNEGRKYLPEVDELFFVHWLCSSFVVGYPYFHSVTLLSNFKIMFEFCTYLYLNLWFPSLFQFYLTVCFRFCLFEVYY